MFDFTLNSKKAIQYALDEAANLGSLLVEPEHILLGLISEGNSSVVQSLLELGISSYDVRKQVLAIISAQEPSAGWPPDLSKASRKVLNLAREIAHELGASSIETPHLLLAIFRHKRNLAVDALREIGLEVEIYNGTNSKPVKNKKLTIYSKFEQANLIGQVIAWARSAPRIQWDDDSYDLDIRQLLYARANLQSQIDRNTLLIVCAFLAIPDFRKTDRLQINPNKGRAAKEIAAKLQSTI